MQTHKFQRWRKWGQVRTWRKVTEGSGTEVARRPGDQEVGVGQLTQDTPSAGCENAGGLEAGFGV